MSDLLDAALLVVQALDQCGIRYTIGGSFASSFSGEPRASIDVDIVVDMKADQVPALINLLGEAFYADDEALLRAVRSRSTANVIHQATGAKVDLFIAGAGLEQQQLAHRRRVQVGNEPARYVYIHSPEDILLQKLLWFRKGGETSERQWRDILSILTVQRGRLDGAYVCQTASEFELSDLLERACRTAAVTL